MINKREKVLAFSGGGAHTTSYIGFWRFVYDEKNYRPDLIIGTSGGALFGCFMAAGLTSKEMKRAIQIYEPWKYFRITPLKWFADFIFHWGLIRIKKIQRILDQIFNKYGIDWDSFDETGFQCVITDLTEGKRKYVPKDMKMKLSSAIASSIAIPGIFEPLWIKDKDGRKHCFVDGGICEGYPIKAALNKGRDNVKILAVSPFDVMLKRDYIFENKKQYVHTLYRTLLDAKGEDMIDLLDESIGDYYFPTGFATNHVLDFDIDSVKNNIDLGYENTKKSSSKICEFFEK